MVDGVVATAAAEVNGLHLEEKKDEQEQPGLPDSAPLDETLQAMIDDGGVVLVKRTTQLVELQTILKDRSTDHSDFVFYADRLMRCVIEATLNLLPYSELAITTPTHCKYNGIQFARGNCGVSLCRSGEAMELALRQCCRSIRICKMLLGDEQRVLYARLTPDISSRRVLLLYPIITTGNTTVKAISTLLENGVEQENIYLITVFSTPLSVKRLMNSFPHIHVITSDIGNAVPHNFAMKYFGTD